MTGVPLEVPPTLTIVCYTTDPQIVLWWYLNSFNVNVEPKCWWHKEKHSTSSVVLALGCSSHPITFSRLWNSSLLISVVIALSVSLLKHLISWHGLKEIKCISSFLKQWAIYTGYWSPFQNVNWQKKICFSIVKRNMC